MSKSIYKEAIEYTRILNGLPTETRNHLLTIIEQTLEQAQKQEKLLELYKEAFDLLENSDEFYGAEPKNNVAWDELKDLKQQIKEIENDEKG